MLTNKKGRDQALPSGHGDIRGRDIQYHGAESEHNCRQERIGGIIQIESHEGGVRKLKGNLKIKEIAV